MTATARPVPVAYPPVDQDDWRRRARVLSDLWGTLATEQHVSVGPAARWTVMVERAEADLPAWLHRVDALVPTDRLDLVSLRAWTSDFDVEIDPPEASPLIYLELVACSESSLGIPALRVFGLLAPPAEDLARAEHPRLGEPRVEVYLDRGDWLRYARNTA